MEDGERKVLARTEGWEALGREPAELEVVVRTEAELLTAAQCDKASGEAGRAKVLAGLTRALGVKAIAWDRHMLVVVGNGPDVAPASRRSIRIGELTARDGKMTIPVRMVRISPRPRKGQPPPAVVGPAPCPVQILLVERFAGPVSFAVQHVVGG